MIKKRNEQEHIIEFLAGLNLQYDPIWIQVLGKEPLPPFWEVFSNVQREESHRSIMLRTTFSEQSVLATSASRDI